VRISEKKHIALASKIIGLRLGSLKQNGSQRRPIEATLCCDNPLFLVEDPLVKVTRVGILHSGNDRKPPWPTEPQRHIS